MEEQTLSPDQFKQLCTKWRPMAIIPGNSPQFGFDIVLNDGSIVKVWLGVGIINFSHEQES